MPGQGLGPQENHTTDRRRKANHEKTYLSTGPGSVPGVLHGRHCFGGGGENPGEDINPLVVTASMRPNIFTSSGFNQECWVAGTGAATDFDYTYIKYIFPDNI